MVVTRSNILKVLKDISSTHQLSKDASEKLEHLFNDVLLPKLIGNALKIAMNRSGGKRKITREDIETALFGYLSFTLFTGADNEGKHSRTHVVSGSAIRKFVVGILENERQYQKLPSESTIYLRGVIDYMLKYIVQQAVTRSRLEEGSKRLTSDHIVMSIAKNDELMYLFPGIAVAYWRNKSESLAPKGNVSNGSHLVKKKVTHNDNASNSGLGLF
jgi:hypothetical protein